MDLNVLHIPRYTLVDPHHYHHSLPWNPMNLTEVTIHKVAEFPLHPLLPTNTNMAGFVGEAILSGFIQKLVDMVTSPSCGKEKQMTNPLVKIWLDELRDLAYDVEDILDDFATEALRSSLIMAQPQQGTSKIEEITARLQDISAQKNDLDLREIAGGWSDRKRKRAQILPTTSLVVESDVYGRETDKAAIVDMLLKHDPSSDDEVSVIPIVGQIEGEIFWKKFLLVLDDVWNENCHEWDTLCMPMRAGAAGSKLIVTTRNEGVAAVTRTCPAYPLRELSNNDCLSLFTQQALRTRNFDAHPHLKEVGEEIVRRCKGLPLAAKALGGMLRNQLSRDAWANILTSRIWDLPEDKSHILPALIIPKLDEGPIIPNNDTLNSQDCKRCKSLPALANYPHSKFVEMAEWEYWFCPDAVNEVMRWSDWLVLLEEQRLPCNLKMLSIQGDANLEKLLNGLQTLTCLNSWK
ncbi:putative disease resistance protein RGA3 [Vitis vinifera]|uniref:Putative disease resistance protein RGA3 n=1 Tax=Vitis vinifera TaxID=29760 RepID=A0A438GG86_VITVI|nr:putative disease resistance protein RGA3 [Vitis vinifera]